MDNIIETKCDLALEIYVVGTGWLSCLRIVTAGCQLHRMILRHWEGQTFGEALAQVFNYCMWAVILFTPCCLLFISFCYLLTPHSLTSRSCAVFQVWNNAEDQDSPREGPCGGTTLNNFVVLFNVLDIMWWFFGFVIICASDPLVCRSNLD